MPDRKRYIINSGPERNSSIRFPYENGIVYTCPKSNEAARLSGFCNDFVTSVLRFYLF